MKLIISLLIFASCSSFLFADKDWTCDSKSIHSSSVEISLESDKFKR